jgi:predicted dehydrogenase
MSLIPRVAVTGAGHLGSRPTDKHAAKHTDAAVFVVAADAHTSADRAGATAQDHNAAACTSLPAAIPAMNAISLLVSSSRHYKIAAEFLEAGIHYLGEKYLRENIYAKIIRVKTQLSK